MISSDVASLLFLSSLRSIPPRSKVVMKGMPATGVNVEFRTCLQYFRNFIRSSSAGHGKISVLFLSSVTVLECQEYYDADRSKHVKIRVV